MTVRELVVAQILAMHGSAVIGLQIAIFGAQQHAALFHDARCNRRVHVGCDVPVERQAEFGAAAAGSAASGSQQSALAFIVQREIQPGRVKDRHSLENQGGVARGGLFRIVVEAQVGGAYKPVRIAPGSGGAGAVGGVGEAVLARALEIHVCGLALSGGEIRRWTFLVAGP